MEEVASWLEANAGIDILLWNDPRAFPLGEFTLARLVDLSRVVDAAVFVFGQDDKTWYRNAEVSQPRDNVLLEYGLFASQLGLKRTVTCRIASSKIASDLLGLNFLGVAPGKMLDAKKRLREWLREIRKQVLSETGAAEVAASIKFPSKCDHVARLLLPEELDAALSELPGWRVVAGSTHDDPPKAKHELAKVFRFASFRQAIEFMALWQ